MRGIRAPVPSPLNTPLSLQEYPYYVLISILLVDVTPAHTHTHTFILWHSHFRRTFIVHSVFPRSTAQHSEPYNALLLSYIYIYIYGFVIFDQSHTQHPHSFPFSFSFFVYSVYRKSDFKIFFLLRGRRSVITITCAATIFVVFLLRRIFVLNLIPCIILYGIYNYMCNN